MARTPLPLPTLPARNDLPTEHGTIALSEVLASLSRALDLTEGQPLGHSVRACMIGMRLGAEAGMNEEGLADLYYALLLKDAGCSSNAARVASMFGSDDRAVKPHMKTVDWDDRMRLAVATWRSAGQQESLGRRVARFLAIAQQENLTKDLIAARCERGADIAQRLGFPNGTVEAIRSLDEHWNGKGYPTGKRGDEIPLASRVLNLAQSIEVFWRTEGPDGTEEMLRARRGRWFDPKLTDLVLKWVRDADFFADVDDADVESRVLELEPAQRVRRVQERELDQIAEAFAEIIDAKSPFTWRHSSQVAMFAHAIGRELNLTKDELVQLKRAGLLHDIGKVGVSNSILDKAGKLDPDERAAVEQHPVHTWEILRRVSAFAQFARQAATHHEKLDGSGYPWRLTGEEMDVPARILVVADIYEALTADRPYRKGLSPEGAFEILNRERVQKLDSDAIAALESALAKDSGDAAL